MVVACYTVYSIIHEVLRALTLSFSCICDVSLVGLKQHYLCTAASVKLIRASISREHSVHLKNCDSCRTKVLFQMSEAQGRAFSTAAR